MKTVAVVSVLLIPLFAFAEDPAARRAREELERELSAIVETAPAKVKIIFSALDNPQYALREATFLVDGRPVKTQSLETLEREGDHVVFQGEVPVGKHTISARIEYQNTASVVISEEGDYKWKLSGDVSFPVANGIEVQVRVVPARDPSQEIPKRFKLALPATPVMIAKLEDATMPAPPSKQSAAVVDAGSKTAVAVVEKPPEKEPVKEVVKETASEARAEAEPREPRARARERQDKGTRLVGSATESPGSPTEPIAAADAGAAEVAMAGEELEPIAAIDAGAVAAVVATPPVAQREPEREAVPSPNESVTALGVTLIAAGVIAAIIGLVLWARRRPQPPTA